MKDLSESSGPTVKVEGPSRGAQGGIFLTASTRFGKYEICHPEPGEGPSAFTPAGPTVKVEGPSRDAQGGIYLDDFRPILNLPPHVVLNPMKDLSEPVPSLAARKVRMGSVDGNVDSICLGRLP